MKNQIKIRENHLELPSYMTHLAQDEIDTVADDNSIVAAGMHPRDGKVMLILSSGHIMMFDADSYFIPRGRYLPNSGGKTVFLPNEAGRWPGDVSGFTVQSSWLISKSVSAISEAELLLNNQPLGIMQI